MIIQISAGQGPEECQQAVGLLRDSLIKEFSDMKCISENPGRLKGLFKSVQLKTEEDVSMLDGSVEWVCKSSLRPNHKRKNWFIDVSVINELEEGEEFNESDCRFERFHCGGNGGQNVNKVETGVRLIHTPTGITVTSTEERSQYLNRQKALEKLKKMIKDKGTEAVSEQKNYAWYEQTQLKRGNPIRIYEGLDFRLRKKS